MKGVKTGGRGPNPPGKQLLVAALAGEDLETFKAEEAEREAFAGKLTPREAMFITEYLEGAHRFNGRRAAMAAGYSEASATTMASEVLRKPYIQEEIKRRVSEQASVLGLTKGGLLADLVREATYDPGEVVAWNADGPVPRDSLELTPDQRKLVTEISSSPGQYGTAVRVKLADRSKAREMLAKVLRLIDPDENRGNTTNITLYLAQAHGVDPRNEAKLAQIVDVEARPVDSALPLSFTRMATFTGGAGAKG